MPVTGAWFSTNGLLFRCKRGTNESSDIKGRERSIFKKTLLPILAPCAVNFSPPVMNPVLRLFPARGGNPLGSFRLRWRRVVSALQQHPILNGRHHARPALAGSTKSVCRTHGAVWSNAARSLILNLQHLLKLRQVSRAVRTDQCHVLQTDSTDSRIVKTRLHGHDMAGEQLIL